VIFLDPLRFRVTDNAVDKKVGRYAVDNPDRVTISLRVTATLTGKTIPLHLHWRRA